MWLSRPKIACAWLKPVACRGIPGLTAIAALWLGATMVGALPVHIHLLHKNPGDAVVLLVLDMSLVRLRHDELGAALSKIGARG